MKKFGRDWVRNRSSHIWRKGQSYVRKSILILLCPCSFLTVQDFRTKKQKVAWENVSRGGHRHLQIGRMLDIDLISEEFVWPEGLEAIHSQLGSQDVTYLSLHPMPLPPPQGRSQRSKVVILPTSVITISLTYELRKGYVFKLKRKK